MMIPDYEYLIIRYPYLADTWQKKYGRWLDKAATPDLVEKGYHEWPLR